MAGMLLLLLACKPPPDSKASGPDPIVDLDGAELYVQGDGQLHLVSAAGTAQDFRLGFGFVADYNEKTS